MTKGIISIFITFFITNLNALEPGVYKIKKSINIEDLNKNKLIYNKKSLENYRIKVNGTVIGGRQQFSLWKASANGKEFIELSNDVYSSKSILSRSGVLEKVSNILSATNDTKLLGDIESNGGYPPNYSDLSGCGPSLEDYAVDSKAISNKPYEELLCILKKIDKKEWVSKDSYINLKMLKNGFNTAVVDLNLKSVSSRKHFYSQILHETGRFRILAEKGSTSYFSKKTYGKKWKGRGVTQLTGCANYINFLLAENIHRAGLADQILYSKNSGDNVRSEIIRGEHFSKSKKEHYMKCSDTKVKSLLKSSVFKKSPYNKINFNNPDIVKVMTSSADSLDKLATGKIKSIGGLSSEDLNIRGSVHFWKRKILRSPKLKKALSSESDANQTLISKAVNGGTRGLADRKAMFKYAKGCVK